MWHTNVERHIIAYTAMQSKSYYSDDDDDYIIITISVKVFNDLCVI